MTASPATLARDRRILAAHAAGATARQIALAEEIDPAIVRRVLASAGYLAGPLLNARPARLAGARDRCSR